MMILESVVERDEVRGQRSAGQGATTRHGYSMARRSNTAMRYDEYGIRLVVTFSYFKGH